MKRTSLSLGVAGLALLVLGACDAPTVPSPADSPAKDEELSRLVEAMGFRGDMVQDFGDYVLVEEDIMITKAQLRSATSHRTSDPMGPRFQYRTTNLVGNTKVNQITVDLSGLASQPAWQTAAATALAHWSGITDSHVKMVQGSPADITVSTTCTASNVAAFASFPSAGNPGSTVYVNTCFAYSTSAAQKLHNMVHEFGHTLGFRHSNYTQLGESAGTEGAEHIYGTPTSGNASGSVMNGGTALNSWAGFAASDLTAARSIYPLPVPVITSVTNSGGYPLITWNAVSGATSYTVSLITYNTINGQYQGRWFSSLTNTAGTSFLDTNNAWTGAYTCSSGYDDERLGRESGRWYEYSVQAHFPNGTSNRDAARYYAPIAQEGCW